MDSDGVSSGVIRRVFWEKRKWKSAKGRSAALHMRAVMRRGWVERVQRKHPSGEQTEIDVHIRCFCFWLYVKGPGEGRDNLPDVDESLAFSVIDCRDSDLPKDNGPVRGCPTPDLDVYRPCCGEGVHKTRVQYDDDDELDPGERMTEPYQNQVLLNRETDEVLVGNSSCS
jgi:hypothetical protein